MDFSAYGRLTFRHPVYRTSETVGFSAVVWALIGGPLYYWKKGARIEAILLCVASVPWFFYDSGSALISYATLAEIATLVWAASVVGAPLILAMSYRRRGWIAVGEAARGETDDADGEDRFGRDGEEDPRSFRRRRAVRDVLLD